MAAKIYKINFKSDFVLTIQSDAGWSIPFCIKFWTGMPAQAYFAGFDGKEYRNCRMGDRPDKLIVLFDDHHLPIGELKMQIAYHTTIEEFPTVVMDEVTNAQTVKTDIDGEEHLVVLDFTGETAPEIEFSLPAYYNEQQRIENELQRQENELQRQENELARQEAEIYREQATAAAVEGAGHVNAQLDGTILTVTNRNGESTSSDVQGPAGPPGRTVQSDWSQDNPSADDYIKNKPDIYTKQQTDGLLWQKQDVIQDLQTIRDNAKDGKQALTDVQAIEEKIPQQASSQNQLADKNFVNSSVATNTAYYISDNGQPFASLADLEAYSGTLTNNDYAFVVGTDSAGNTTYTRYKYNADTQQWAEEYVLNNSSFTAEQWAAISSGITSGDVEKLRALPTKAQLDLLFDGKQNVINDLSDIRSGASAGATAVQPASIANMEVTSNKVTAISDQSTNTQYPSAKAVYDFVGGALSKYVEHGTDDTTFMLTPNCFHIWGEVAALTLTLPSLLLPGYEFVFQFTSGATATALSLPSSLKWFTPHTVKDRTLYQVRILNGCASMQGVDISLAGDPYVDLGLPSGVKWAKRNIDITRDSGFTSSDYEYDCSFFSWGNIDGHNPTSSSSFSPWDWGGVNGSEPYYEGQVYGSTPGNTLTGNIPVGAEYDAARAILGSPWRMPTSSEYKELFDNTIFLDANGDEIPSTTTNKLVTIEGIVGIRLASKINGNELFFPCSGGGNGTSRDGRGSYGFYWSSTWYSARSARGLYFYSGGVYPQDFSNRYYGFAVRAVQ